jgi:hypothetical protein
VTSIWHSSSIDLLKIRKLNPLDKGEYIDYSGQDLQLRGHLRSAVLPAPPSLEVDRVAGFWGFDLLIHDSHGLAQESHIYSLIQDASIAPRFLAHLTANHERVIGYALEYVDARAAGIGDVDLCRAALQKLHNLGIAHGHLIRDAPLIRLDIHVAQMRGFFSAYETTNRDIFDNEMSRLEEVLQQHPQPAPVVKEQLTAFWQRDGWVHPVVFSQIKHEGQISISPEDHQAMLADLEKRDWRCTAQDIEDDVERLRRNRGKWN